MSGCIKPGCLVQVGSDTGLPALGQLQSIQDGECRVFLLSGDIVNVDPSAVRVPSKIHKPLQGGDESSFDIVLGPQTSDAMLGEEISRCLFEKGFCVLRLCQQTKDRERAVKVMQDLAEDGTLGRLPEEVEEGYLGMGGKGRIMWLDPDKPETHVDEVLLAADQNLSYLASVLMPFSGDIFDHSIKERTPALLSLSLDEEEEEDYPQPPADDKMLGDFLGTWRRGLVKAVHFMGPGTTILELETREGPKAAALPLQQEVISIAADPSTIVLFRPDCFTPSVTYDGEVLTMSTSFLWEQTRWALSTNQDIDPSTWLCLGGSIAPNGPPPPEGSGIKVTNLGTRLPAEWDEPEMYNTGLNAGTDAVIEIPITRFDINEYWTDDGDSISIANPKMNQKHTSFVEGIELFDNKYFEISSNEAGGMDPLQRQVLEVGSTLLYQRGITKKVSNRKSHHVGFSVGLDKADFPTLGLPGGSTNALAIVANRFSFVFNLKGPNYICDTACSASLTSTHLAKPLLMDRVWDVLDFHIALGTHLCLSPGPWIGCSLAHMTSPAGRCFTFDSSASGYLRGEGTSGMILQYGEYGTDGVIYRASQVGQDGRSASLTAPNGPAQEEIISRAIREAKMTPPESTCWECHGTGTSLGDPIEVGAVRKIQKKMPRPEPLMMSTSKSNIGHLEGGAAMAAMVKSVLSVKHNQCLATLHVKQLNPHLEHSVFDAFFETERSSYAFERGHCQISSFGFGGTNGHVVFWGKSIAGKEDVQSLLLRRISKMSPAEIRPVGTNPDNWDSDLPDADIGPNDQYSIVLGPEDPIDEPIKWIKMEGRQEMDDENDVFYTITGTFNSWQQDSMAPGTVPGQHTIVIFVPADGAVEFRFLKNGDEKQVLAPQINKCPSKCMPIRGPQEGLTNTWSVKAAPNSRLRIELLCLKHMHSVLWMAD
eukprot:gb/GFBE01039780.1/.p1 GENE.gb/GFBE01039780.1/~~gb/GFBE01039780.1/.p1  ORF type:complete len:934 (+),score=220.82 gb/GFBE01039780.1/:1-2802(+)